MNGAIAGYSEIEKEAFVCQMQGFFNVFLGNVLLCLVATMNLNLYCTIVITDADYVPARRWTISALTILLPLLLACISIPGLAMEIVWCAVPMSKTWEYYLASTIIPISLYLIVGSYWWMTVCSKIYRIYREVTPDEDNKIVALMWVQRFWRQLVWIGMNLYLFVMVIAGFFLYYDTPPSYDFHRTTTWTLSLISFFCFLVFFATNDNLLLWLSFLPSVCTSWLGIKSQQQQQQRNHPGNNGNPNTSLLHDSASYDAATTSSYYYENNNYNSNYNNSTVKNNIEDDKNKYVDNQRSDHPTAGSYSGSGSNSSSINDEGGAAGGAGAGGAGDRHSYYGSIKK